jgi:HK97 gp10 family phage protein
MAMQGRAALLRKLARLPRAVKADSGRAVVSAADDLVARQKQAVAVDTGALRASIVATPTADGLRVRVTAGGPKTTVEARKGSGAKWDYALGVEFGVAAHKAGGLFAGARHPGQAAQPFFYPTWRLTKRAARAKISRAIGKSVKKAFAGG